VFDTFGEKLDGFSVEEELESLRKGVSLGHGSWITKRRLRQLLSKESISPPGPGPRISTEFVDAEQEPALLHACKLGLHDAVIQLLKDSADASVANRHGTTALHYLGSFDDEHIPDICKRLIEAGATTEARSEERRQQEPFVGIIQIAHINQTPLMWAVIADNKVAVEVLVAWRANPFHPTSETKYSPPLVEAAQHHQHEILRIPLSETAIGETPWWQEAAIEGALAHCCNYTGPAISRLLLHGKKHQEAFERTVDILAEHGADLGEVFSDGKDTPLYSVPTFVVDYLLGPRTPLKAYLSPLQWIMTVRNAAFFNNKHLFGALLSYSQAVNIHVSPEDWKSYFRLCWQGPDDIWHLEPFREHRDPSDDYGEDFMVAFGLGKLNIARWLYSTGVCDLTQLRPVGVPEEANIFKNTPLGGLIFNSKAYSNTASQLRRFLKLPYLPDSLLEVVAEQQGSSFTALHAAVHSDEGDNGAVAGTPILRLILGEGDEPETLNAQITEGFWKGQTPLHIAAGSSNRGAVQHLLESYGESLDLTVREANGMSIVDIAAVRLIFTEDIKITHRRVCEGPLGWARNGLRVDARGTSYYFRTDASTIYRPGEPRFKKRAETVLALLLEAGGRGNRIRFVVTRTGEKKLRIEDLGYNQNLVIQFGMSSYGSFPTLSLYPIHPTHHCLHGDIYVQAFYSDICNLPEDLDQCLFWTHVAALGLDQTFCFLFENAAGAQT